MGCKQQDPVGKTHVSDNTGGPEFKEACGRCRTVVFVMFTLLLGILSIGESITQTALCGPGFESECAQALGGSVALGLLLTSMT